jgi:hypothetical protein
MAARVRLRVPPRRRSEVASPASACARLDGGGIRRSKTKRKGGVCVALSRFRSQRREYYVRLASCPLA